MRKPRYNSQRYKYKNKKIRWLPWVIIGLILIVLFFLAYGTDLINNTKTSGILSSVSIQKILENPREYNNQSLELTGYVYKQGGLVFIRDNEGYKLEIKECSNNRDLTLDEKITIKGYIFDIENPVYPVFYCGVFDNSEYWQRYYSIQEKLRQQEEQKKLIKIRAEEERKIQEELQRQSQIIAQQKLSDENRRQGIENDYKIKLAAIPSGAEKSQIDIYDWLPPLSECLSDMRGWTLGGCTGCRACIYEEILENKYKVNLIVQYRENGKTYRGYILDVSSII